MGNELKAVGNTVGDIGNAGIHGVRGSILKVSTLTAANPKARNQIRMRANQHLKKAANHANGGLIGELQIDASITGDIAKPYDITLSSVETDYKINRGLCGLIASPVLATMKSNLRKTAATTIQNKMRELCDKLREKIKNIDFVQNESLNGYIQSMWEPQHITAEFTQYNEDGLRLTLNSEKIALLIQQIGILGLIMPSQTINTTFHFRNVAYAVRVVIDFNARKRLCRNVWNWQLYKCDQQGTKIHVEEGNWKELS